MERNTSQLCSYCEHPGYNEDACWKKHGRQSRVGFLLQGRKALIPAAATVFDDDRTRTFR